MCGIFGYIGKLDCVKETLLGLKQLEYRGYDSAGIAGILEGKILTCKKQGKIAALETEVKNKDFKLEVAIGHTRWATHGEPNETNAHPHVDSLRTLSLVHNGIIENYEAIKDKLLKNGVVFQSETDTEVLAQLLASHYHEKEITLLKALSLTLQEVQGSLAIAIIHKDYPGQIIAASRQSPLAIGYNDEKSEIIISSDPNAFLGRDLNVFYLSNDEIAVVHESSIEVYNDKIRLLQKMAHKLEGENQAPTKNGYEHFMLKEIFEQPLTIQKAMLGHYSDEYGTALFEHLSFTAKELMATSHIVIIACGSSWHAGAIAASWLREKARIPSEAVIGSEFRYTNPILSNETLVIAISQSGETADTLAAVREAKAKGAKILGICNVANSSLTRESNCCILLNAGPEFSVCSTKAFTSQLTILSLFTLFMARLRHLGKEEGQRFLSDLKTIPLKIEQVLAQQEEIKKFSQRYAQYDQFFFLGKSYMYHTALEAALKLKEISYLNANAYPAGEMKHGPIALIDKNHPVVAFCANAKTYEKMLSNLMEAKTRGAPILAIVPYGAEGITKIADHVLYLPVTTDELSPFLSTVAGQLFAYWIAKERKTEIDQPRNLAKSVTVE